MTTTKEINPSLQEKLTLATLESVLSSFFRPSFLHITPPDEDGDISIIISASAFTDKTSQERIQAIMGCILSSIPEIYENRLVIIQAYDEKQFEDVIDFVFEEE